MTFATILLSFALLSSADMPAPAQAAWRAAQSGQTTQPAEHSATADQANPAQSAVQPAAAPCATGTQAPADHQAPCKTSSHKKHHPHTTASDSGAGPSKTIVRHGSTSDPNVRLGPGGSPQQAKQSQTTAQLLATTSINLTRLGGRTLSSDQQGTVDQVKRYMDQSKAAASAGDVQRAYNLALKANLLSAELVGR